MKKVIISEELLTGMYVNKKMSTYAIADELGVNRQTINNKLKEFGIKLRPRNYSRNPKPKKLKRKKLYTDKEHFESTYTRLQTLDKVASFYGISFDTAYSWKDRHGIETIVKRNKRGVKSSNKPYANADYLEEMYKKHSSYELAKMWNCSPSTIHKRLKNFGIPTRKLEEQWDRNPKSGVIRLTVAQFNINDYLVNYSNVALHSKANEFIKSLVGKCQSCGESEVIDLHHIDENHSNNLPENHAVLCPNCHARIHRLGKSIDELCPNRVVWTDLLDTYAEAK